MKITPENFAAVYQFIVGEPGPADFHDSLIAQHACRCDNCGTWWCDGEIVQVAEFDADQSFCIDCWEGFANVWNATSVAEHEAASRGLALAQEAVEFRTLDEARAYWDWREATDAFRAELLDVFHAVSAAKGYVATLQPLYRPCDVRPGQLFTAAAVFEHFAKDDPALNARVSDVKHLIDAIVMLRPDILDRRAA